MQLVVSGSRDGSRDKSQMPEPDFDKTRNFYIQEQYTIFRMRLGSLQLTINYESILIKTMPALICQMVTNL